MWIKTSSVLLAFLFWLPKVVPQSSENIYRETRECQHQHGITDEEYEKIMRQRYLPKEEPEETRRCFAECVMAAEKLMKDGKLDEDAVFQIMQEGFNSAGVTMDEEYIRNVISDCITNSDTGKCTSGYNSWICVTAILADYGGESNKHEEAVEKKCKATYNVDESIFIEGKSGYEEEDVVILKDEKNESIFIEGKSGYEEEDVVILKDEKNENHRCYVQCLMEGFGYIKDGELDQEFLMQDVLKELAEKGANVENQKLKEAIKLCAEKTGEEKCERTYQIAKCITYVGE